MSKTRKITVAILLLITVSLAALSVYVAFQIQQQDAAPDDSSADVVLKCGRILCKDGREAGADCDTQQDTCMIRAEEFCGVGNVQDASIDVENQCANSELPCNGKSWKYTSADCIEVCSTITTRVFAGDSCPTTQVPLSNQTLGPGNYCGSTSSFTNTYACTQLDPITDEDGGGVCGCKPTHLECVDNACRSVVGAGSNSCATDNDCKPDAETPQVTTQCVDGDSRATVTWEALRAPGENVVVSVDTDQNFQNGTDGFWRRVLPNGTTSVVVPNGFDGVAPQTGRLTLTPGTRYYVRIRDQAESVTYPIISFVARTCVTTSATAAGSVFCQDTNGTRYNIPNAVATLTYSDNTTAQISTNTNGDFTLNNINTSLSFDLSIATPIGSLPTGQPYSAMTGPTATNCSNGTVTGCTGDDGNYCSANQSAYDQCTLPTGNGTGFNFRFTNCDAPAAGCIDLAEIGPDPIDAGVGNTVVYILQYRQFSATDPFPSIRLRVGPDGSEVGRDNNDINNELVAPSQTPTYDSATGIWTYIFVWESAQVGGADVPNGTYDVRILLDGTNATVLNSASCIDTITVTNGTTQEPAFTVVKTGASVCQEDGAQRIDYTITATNVGPITGVIDFVEDTYDPNLTAFGISPTNISPTFGQDTGTTILWVGTVSDRTFTAGQSKTYSYSVSIPQSLLVNFQGGINNQVQLDYTTDSTNTVTYTQRMELECSIPGIPTTGIFDDGRYLLIGFGLITMAIFVYKNGVGSAAIDTVLSQMFDMSSKQINKLSPFETRIENSMERKRKKKK